MATTIKLYFSTGIRPEKNAVIEDIAAYLSTKSSVEYSINRFIEHDTSVSIKIDTIQLPPVSHVTAGEASAPFKDVSSHLDYCAIKNAADSQYVYYYILNKKWIATYTLLLELAIDALTSFADCYEFTAKTLVEREHKDRFINYPVTIGSATYLPRKLYLDGDGITPQLYHEDLDDDIENADAAGDWYLMYVANNETGAVEGKDYPINAYIINETEINQEIYTYRINKETLTQTTAYWFGSALGDSFSTTDYMQINGRKVYLNGLFKIEKEIATPKWNIYQFWGNLKTKYIYNDFSIIDFSATAKLYIVDKDKDFQIENGSIAQAAATIKQLTSGTLYPTKTKLADNLNAIESVDRTDTRLLSIIKLPYAPINIIIPEEGEIQLPSEVTIESITWQNQQTNYYFKVNSNYLSAFENEIKIANYAVLMYEQKSKINDTRNDETESALYRSEFYQFRFVYDSFVYTLPFEMLADDFLKTLKPSDKILSLKMITTSTMNSRFLFDFENSGNGFKFKKSEQDYPHIMVVARNNNIAIYNSEYINYMRNGYNYDVKAKNAELLNAGLNIGTGVLSTGIGLITGGVGVNIRAGAKAAQFTKEAAQAAALSESLLTAGEAARGAAQTPYINAAIGQANTAANAYKQAQAAAKQYNPTANVLALGQAINGVTGIIKGVQQIQQTEREFAQKQHAIRQASVSVSGSDDIDLLTYYSHNRLKSEVWQCSDRMKKALADLYFYQGYATQEQKVPTHNNRKWFDFLRCQADIKNVKNIDQRFIDNIKDRLSIGVTYYHNVNGVWDIEQTKGNPETWI